MVTEVDRPYRLWFYFGSRFGPWTKSQLGQMQGIMREYSSGCGTCVLEDRGLRLG